MAVCSPSPQGSRNWATALRRCRTAGVVGAAEQPNHGPLVESAQGLAADQAVGDPLRARRRIFVKGVASRFAEVAYVRAYELLTVGFDGRGRVRRVWIVQS